MHQVQEKAARDTNCNCQPGRSQSPASPVGVREAQRHSNAAVHPCSPCACYIARPWLCHECYPRPILAARSVEPRLYWAGRRMALKQLSNPDRSLQQFQVSVKLQGKRRGNHVRGTLLVINAVVQLGAPSSYNDRSQAQVEWYRNDSHLVVLPSDTKAGELGCWSAVRMMSMVACASKPYISKNNFF